MMETQDCMQNFGGEMSYALTEKNKKNGIKLVLVTGR